MVTLDSGIDPDPELRLSPENGNVAFGSTDMAWCFTLRSFAQMYADTYGSLDVSAFADRLWGDIYFNNETRKFTRKPSDPEQSRTFVHFILDPLYKLYSHVLSEETDDLKQTLASLNITLKPVMYKMDVRPLLKVVLDQFFGPATGLVDMIVEHIPSPVVGASTKVERTYTGPQTSELPTCMKACDAEGPLMVQITKLYHTTDAQSFRAFGRVLSGTLRKDAQVKVLGEGYSPEDEEDMMKATVEGLWISESRWGMLCFGCYFFDGSSLDTSSQRTKYLLETSPSSVVSTPLSRKALPLPLPILKRTSIFSDPSSI